MSLIQPATPSLSFFSFCCCGCCCGCDDDYREDCDNDDFNDIPADKAEDVGVVSDACACTEEEIFDKAEDAVESDEV